MRWRSARVRGAAAVIAGVALTAGLLPAHGSEPQPTPESSATTPESASPTYTNPVTAGVVDSFPDPAVIRGKDGAWYAYGTQNPIFNSSGEDGERILPILRSNDLVDWEHVGDVIDESSIPSTWLSNSRAWAPDIRYIGGRYHLTYGLSTGGILLATAPTPTGPWEHHDPIVPRPALPGCPTGNIDQALFTDSDGTLYFYWGSYDVICVSEMTADGTALTGPITQVAQGRRMEGAFVVQRDGQYYLMYSDGGCCAGAFSGYTVKVGRSDSPRGPFVDDDGVDLMNESSKGGYVLASNGNGFAGPGHHTVTTDLAGQDWMVYHAIPTDDPEFPRIDGVGRQLSKRPLMIDRLDWIDGWPVVNAGAGPSSGEQPAPVTTGDIHDTFAGGSFDGWVSRGDVALDEEIDAGSYVTLGEGASLTSLARTDGDVRVQADLRLPEEIDLEAEFDAAGLATGIRGRNGAVAWIDRAAGELRLEFTLGNRTVSDAAPLPATFAYKHWNIVTIEWRGEELTATVAPDDLLEPLAEVRITVPRDGMSRGAIGIRSGGAAHADNISATALAVPVKERVADPEPGALLPEYSDEFDGDVLPGAEGSGWSWVRGPAAGIRLEDGAFAWPTQAAELYRNSNTASVLLRDAPEGDYMVETKLNFDGTRVNQQAGLILYENDDRFVKLVHSILPLNRRPGSAAHMVEFTKEAERPATTPPMAVHSSPMWGAAPAETTWFRLYVRHDAVNDEHEVQMASSTDGETWRWGGAWTLPVQDGLRIGLISMNTPGATARFDYVRTYAMD